MWSDTPCIEFQGKWRSKKGYGQKKVQGKKKYAHVLTWEQANGPKPEVMHLDHLCRNKSCVNLNHLELVTPKENILRGIGPTAQNARKTHCIHGHAFFGENLIIKINKNGTKERKCRACRKASSDKRKQSRRPTIPATPAPQQQADGLRAALERVAAASKTVFDVVRFSNKAKEPCPHGNYPAYPAHGWWCDKCFWELEAAHDALAELEGPK